MVHHCVLVYRFDARGGQVHSHLQLCLGCPADHSLRDRQCCWVIVHDISFLSRPLSRLSKLSRFFIFVVVLLLVSATALGFFRMIGAATRSVRICIRGQRMSHDVVDRSLHHDTHTTRPPSFFACAAARVGKCCGVGCAVFVCLVCSSAWPQHPAAIPQTPNMLERACRFPQGTPPSACNL